MIRLNGRPCPRWILTLLLCLLPVLGSAQYIYTTNGDHTINITGYTGPGGALTITNMINGLPVGSIGNSSFQTKTNLTSVTIPGTVTNIGSGAFLECSNMTTVTIPDSVTSIGSIAFASNGLTSVTIPANLTSIELATFMGCPLTIVVIPDKVASIGHSAFLYCRYLKTVEIGKGVTQLVNNCFMHCQNLSSVYFRGDAPGVTNDSTVFFGDTNTVYYLPGTKGWGSIFDGRPAVCWNPQAQNLSVQSNQFSFAITGSSNLVILVEASTNLANPVWIPLATNTLTGGASSFLDPERLNYSNRFYRLRAP